MASRRNLTTCGLLGAVFLLLSRLASAPQPTAPSGVGVVTSLQGQATVSRQALPGGSALHFKDDVFFRDQIATRERSTVRLLLGGKGVLTVREQSQVTLDETVAPDGGRRSVLNVLAGKIGAAIAHSLMRPGDEVEIRTPDAVAANRGTTLIVEYDPSQKSAEDSKPVPLAASSSTASPAQAAGASGGQSTFLVLTGSVIVTPRGQPPLPLGSMQSVSITVTSGGVKAGTVQNVTPAQAAQGLQTPKPHTGEAAGDANPEAQARIAAAVADAIVQAVKGEQQQAVAAVPGTAPRPSNTIAPIVPQVSQQQVAAPGSSTTPPSSGTTTPPVPPVVAIGLSPGPLLSLTDLNVGVDAGSPLITFSAGAPNTVTPVAVDAGIITSPLIEATGPTIAHSGPIASLAGSSIVGDQASIGASLVKIGGVPVTNAGGPVFSLGGGSAVSTSGSVLDVGTGGSAELAGLVDITGASTLALSRADGIAVVAGSLTVTDALFKVAGGSSIGTLGGGALAYTDPGILTLHAPILSATDSSIAFTGPVLTATESTVTGDSLGGLVALHNSTLGLTGGALLESQGSTLSFAGAMVRLDRTGSGTASLTSGREGTPLVNLAGDSLTISGTGALLAMNRGGVEVAGSLLSAAGGATLTSTGTTAPLVQLTNGTLSLTNAGSLVSLTGAGATGSGTVLDSGNSTITIDGPIFALRGGSSIAHTGGPVIRLNGGSLTAQGGFVDSDESGNQVTISGALLEATNSNIILGNTRIPKVGPGGTDTIVIAPPAGVPQISLTNGTLTDSSTESLVGFGNGSSTSAGLLLVVAGSAMNLGGELASVENGPDVASTGSAALIQLGGLEMRSNANLVRIEGRGLTLAGPLMTVTGGELDAGKGFLRIAGGGSLIGTSSEPLISLSGTTIIGGSGPGTDTGGAFLNLRTDAESTTASRLALSGPLLKATNSFFDSTDSSFIAIRDNAILTSTSTAPLVELTGSTVEADSSIIRVGPFATNDAGTAILGNGVPPSVSLAGPALRATDTHFTARTGSFLTIRDLVTGRLTGTGPLIELVGTTSGATTVTAPSGNFLTLASARNQPPRLSLPGPLLDAGNTAFTVGDPGVSADAFLFVGDGARLAGASRDPLIHLSGSSLSASGSFLAVRRSGATPSTVTLAGPLLSASDTSFTTFNTVSPGGCCAFVFVGEGASLQGDGSGPLLQFNGSTVRMDGALFNLGSGPGQPDSTATLNGPLLTAVNSTFDSGPLSNFVTIHGGATFTSTTTEPLPMVSGGSITTKAHVVRIGLGSPDSQAPVSATLAGPLLLGTDTDISAISGVLTIRDRGTFTSTTTAPLIQLRGTAGSTLALGGPDPDPASPTFGQQLPGQVFAIQPNLATPIAASAELFGPVLSAVNTTITTTDRILRVRGEAGASATLTSHTSEPLVQLTGGSLRMAGTSTSASPTGTTVTTTGTFLPMSSPDPTALASMMLAGPLLRADNTALLGQNHFVNIGNNAHLTSSGVTPAIQLTNSPLTVMGTSTFTPTGSTTPTSSFTFGNFLNICCTNASMDLGGGPLLNAANSPLSVAGGLVAVFGGGRLTGTTTDPLIQLTGGVHAIGSASVFGTGSLLDLRGVTIDAYTGLGTDPVLRTGGPIIELYGATPAMGATVNLSGAGNAIRVDTALLQVSAPIVNLINSTLNTSTTGDATNGAMHIIQSSVTSNGPVIGLNHSTLQVNNGPVLSLTGGSQTTVNGDLASLINRSKVAVLNGPLILVDGGPTATKSTLTINGALVNFAAGTGNQVLINNSIPATRLDTSSNVPIPVRETGPGSLVSITNPTVVKNPANGSVSLTCTTGCVGPYPASVIQVLRGGRVFIKP